MSEIDRDEKEYQRKKKLRIDGKLMSNEMNECEKIRWLQDWFLKQKK